MIPELQYLRGSQQTCTSLHSHHRFTGVHGVGEDHHSFLDPCNSSRAPSTISFHSYHQRGGGTPLNGTCPFSLGRQCLIHLSGLWNFTHDIKTIKKALARAVVLRSHPTISDILQVLFIQFNGPRPPQLSRSVSLQSDHIRDSLEEAVMYSHSQTSSSECPAW